MSTTHTTRLLIIGAGAAGYTAAIYAARANLQPMLVAGEQPGGQLATTTDVENFPGFADPIQGPWLMEQMQAQARNVGVDIRPDTIVQAALAERPFLFQGRSGDSYAADAIILATGAQARWLGHEPPDLQGRGISGCATCDGIFFRKQPVAVIGGGNTAAEEALYLANMAASVTIVHRRDRLRADRILQDRLAANPKISILWNTVVTAFVGSEATGLQGLRLRSHDGAVSDLAVGGAFVAIGHDPATALVRGQLDLDEDGYVITAPDSSITSIPGVFAAGDVKDKVFRQAVTAAGSGCVAALQAERWLGGMVVTA